MIKAFFLSILITAQAFAGLPPTTSKSSTDSSALTTFNYKFPNFTGTHTGTSFSLGNIVGGSIDNAPIGGTTPTSGAFTSLSASGLASLNGNVSTPAIVPPGGQYVYISKIGSGVSSSNPGFMFDTNNQVWGGSFGTGGNFTIQADPTTSTAGASVFFGASARGDAAKSQTRIQYNSTPVILVDGNYTGHNPGYVAIGQTSTSAAVPAQFTVGSTNQFQVDASGNIQTTGTFTGNGSGLTNLNPSNLSASVPASKGGTGLSAPGSTGNCLISNGTAWTSTPCPAAFVGPTIQKFLSGSGTYTLPTSPRSPLYIRVRMAGGGGGGSGGGSSGGTGGNGTSTTFGTSLLVANYGSGAAPSSQGAGGSSSLGTGPIGLPLSGGTGSGGGLVLTNGSVGLSGGIGGSNAFGGAGAGADETINGGPGVANTGAGGGGGSSQPNSSVNARGGSGGGAGGFIDAIITSPASTYSYSVGTGGAAGAAGTSGGSGGAGASGIIIVEEFYQ